MTQEKMRAAAGDFACYLEYFGMHDDLKSAYLETFPTLSLESQVRSKISYQSDDQAYLVRHYAAGMPLPVLAVKVRAAVADLTVSFQFVSGVRGDNVPHTYPVNGRRRIHFEFAGLVLLLAETPDELAQFAKLISPIKAERDYLFDLLIKAFIPSHRMQEGYNVDKDDASWMNPILSALAMPPEQRPAALAAHIKNWPRIIHMKPNPNTESGRMYWRFTFEIALAVCGWDIDDSSFNDHPCYPRDLVEHYRAKLRNTRDGWRARQVGSGVAVTAPAKPPKADLSKSKRKGIARWLELVADGDGDAVEAVLEEVGKPRKIKDFDGLMCALQENGLAVQADIRDDETVTAQVDDLVRARELAEFDYPPGPPFGGTRCTALLRAWDDWLAQRGYRAVDLDGDDDAWHAVVVKAECHAELMALSAELGITARGPSEAWPD